MTPELERALAAAALASHGTVDPAPTERADWLARIADALDASTEELVDMAAVETHLPMTRLTGELGRTTFQLRLIADAVREGSWLEVVIDHADPEWPMGPRPDLRRFLRPLGPVLVFAASNFPFAFSVAGGDTATALGVGCPVLVKTHPGHPRLSRRTAEIVTTALSEAGAPPGTFALVEGQEAGREALTDPRIKAGAFTGSVRGGRALFDLACQRPDPIPFYGELGSTNPAFLLPSAPRQRLGQILEGFVGSFTLGAGQFCTKPGLLFAPAEHRLVDDLTALVATAPRAPLLNEHILGGYADRLAVMSEQWQVTHQGSISDEGATPTLFVATLDQVTADPDVIFEEAFGPTAVLVEYEDPAELVELAGRMPGQLTATLHGDLPDPTAEALLSVLTSRAGRVVWNSWPTGVSVTWAMHHGGGWPATTASTHTSVGPTGMRRFLTPVALQDVPADLLTAVVHEGNPWRTWRRIDGGLVNPQAEDDKTTRVR